MIQHDIEAPTFTRHADGRVTVDRFPQVIAVSPEVLFDSDSTLLQVSDGVVMLTPGNGRAVYRLTGERIGDGWVGELVESVMHTPGGA